METLSYQKEVKANKEHRCNFCGSPIRKGQTYYNSTHKNDGEVYDWKTHLLCDFIATKLNMYEDADEYGVTEEHFQETIYSEYMDLVIKQFEEQDLKKYSDIIVQLRGVRFGEKLSYVIRHYKRSVQP